jgi:DNA repair exonuclease SbcCD ATPase subunit
LAKLKGQLTALNAKIDTLNEEHAAVSYWVGGFKRLRLFIVEETLRQLEIEVNNNLSSLGLTDWQVEFDVERENKSGGVTKGFVVFVRAPGHTEPVKFEAWSGGEIQRLRLAGDLGLANLIMERAGLVNTVEWFDEPSQHLSPTGVLDLAETLAQRAEDQGKRVFMVEHRALDFGGFAGVITAVKDEGGSRLETSY